MSHADRTIQFYSQWTELPGELFSRAGRHMKCSERRSETQEGYSKPFVLYIYINSLVTIVSFKQGCEPVAERILALSGVDEVASFLESAFPGRLRHSLKYRFEGMNPAIDTSRAVSLTRDYFRLFSEFFSVTNGCPEPAWLAGYFDSLVSRRCCWGIVDDNRLVSVTDYPDIPWMKDEIVDVGIATRHEFRNRGFAKAACSSFVKYITDSGKTPIWSCHRTNEASRRLAEAIGFRYLADVLTVSI